MRGFSLSRPYKPDSSPKRSSSGQFWLNHAVLAPLGISPSAAEWCARDAPVMHSDCCRCQQRQHVLKLLAYRCVQWHLGRPDAVVAPSARVRALLPEADDVPGGIAERRDPQVALRIRRRQNFRAGSDYFLQRLIYPLDENIREDARLSGNRQIGHEVPDHVAASILEARIVALGVHSPAEHALVERRQAARVGGGNAQIGDPATPEDARLFPSTRTHDAIIGDARSAPNVGSRSLRGRRAAECLRQLGLVIGDASDGRSSTHSTTCTSRNCSTKPSPTSNIYASVLRRNVS